MMLLRCTISPLILAVALAAPSAVASTVPVPSTGVASSPPVRVCALSEVWNAGWLSQSMRGKVQSLLPTSGGAGAEPRFRGGDKLEKLHGMFPAKLRVYSQRFNDKVRFLWVARNAAGSGKGFAGGGRTIWILTQVLLDHRYERVNYARLIRLALGADAESCGREDGSEKKFVHLGGGSEEPRVAEQESDSEGESFVFLAQDSHLIEVGPALTGQRKFLFGGEGVTKNSFGGNASGGGIQVGWGRWEIHHGGDGRVWGGWEMHHDRPRSLYNCSSKQEVDDMRICARCM